MAKFCTKCGKPLVDGEPCSCGLSNQNEQAAALENQSQAEQIYVNQSSGQANRQSSSDYFKKLFQLFKNIFRYPATEGAKFVISEDRNSSFGLIGGQAVFSALFDIVMISKINSIFSVFNILGDGFKLSYVKVFLVTLIISFALSCGLAGILYGISYLFKNKISYYASLCVVSARSVIIILVTIISIILSYINLSFGLSLFCLGNLAGIGYMAVLFPVTSQENKNKAALIVLISMVIFIYIGSFITVKCAPLYFPESIKDSIGSMSKLMTNPSSLIKDIIGNIY